MKNKTLKALFLSGVYLSSAVIVSGSYMPRNDFMRQIAEEFLQIVHSSFILRYNEEPGEDNIDNDEEPDEDNIEAVMIQKCNWICQGNSLEEFDEHIVETTCIRRSEREEVSRLSDMLQEAQRLHRIIISILSDQNADHGKRFEGILEENQETLIKYQNRLRELDEYGWTRDLLEYLLFDEVVHCTKEGSVKISVLDLILYNWRQRSTPEVLKEENGRHILKASFQDSSLRAFLLLYETLQEMHREDFLIKILTKNIANNGPVWLFLFSSASELLLKTFEEHKEEKELCAKLWNLQVTLPNKKEIHLKDLKKFLLEAPGSFNSNDTNDCPLDKENQELGSNEIDKAVAIHSALEHFIFE